MMSVYKHQVYMCIYKRHTCTNNVFSSSEVVPSSACSLLGGGGQATAGQECVKEEQVLQTLNLSKAQFFLAFVIYCSRN